MTKNEAVVEERERAYWAHVLDVVNDAPEPAPAKWERLAHLFSLERR